MLGYKEILCVSRYDNSSLCTYITYLLLYVIYTLRSCGVASYLNLHIYYHQAWAGNLCKNNIMYCHCEKKNEKYR